MHSGYHSDTMINNAVAYGAEGKVFLCGLNLPVSWHDGSIYMNLLPIIKSKVRGYKTCVDQSFPHAGEAHRVLVGQYKKNSAATLSPMVRPYLLHFSNTFVSLR